MTTRTAPRRPFGEGILPAEPTGVQCKPLSIGPDKADDDNHEGYCLGLAGEPVELAGRSASFRAGFATGRRDFVGQVEMLEVATTGNQKTKTSGGVEF
jgi:hypothetical protein